MCTFEEKNLDESDDTLQSINIRNLSRHPVCLWAKDLTVAPLNYVGLVKSYVMGSEASVHVFDPGAKRGATIAYRVVS